MLIILLELGAVVVNLGLGFEFFSAYIYIYSRICILIFIYFSFAICFISFMVFYIEISQCDGFCFPSAFGD